MTETVIVGAGLAGCATARFLAEAGHDVTLIERHGIGAGASGRNGGWLVRRPDPWINGLREQAREIYQGLEDEGLDCGLRELALLLVGLDESELAHAAGYVETLGASPVDVQAEPWLADDVPGAYLVDGCHSVEPMAATVSMAEAARRAGARIRLGEEVKRIVVEAGRAVGVLTDDGRIGAERVVVCAGPMVGPLLARVGIDVPISAVRGWLVQTDPADIELPYVVEQALWPDQRSMAAMSSTPTLAELADGEEGASRLVSLLMGSRPGGALVIGTSLNGSVREDPEGSSTVHEIARRALRVAPRLGAVRVVAAWSGRRAMLPDGRPLVGALPGVDGLAVAGGFSSVGMVTIPGACRAFAEGRAQPELDPARFAGRACD